MVDKNDYLEEGDDCPMSDCDGQLEWTPFTDNFTTEKFLICWKCHHDFTGMKYIDEED